MGEKFTDQNAVLDLFKPGITRPVGMIDTVKGHAISTDADVHRDDDLIDTNAKEVSDLLRGRRAPGSLQDFVGRRVYEGAEFLKIAWYPE